MLMPKRVKRRKQFRGSMAGKATKGTAITYGEFGLRFSQINRLQQNLQKLVWVLVKVHWNIG